MSSPRKYSLKSRRVDDLLGNTGDEEDRAPTNTPVPQPSVELLTIDRIHEIIEPTIAALLGPSGFESHRKLAWVRSGDAPIRQIFKVEQYKGAALGLAWGLSLDFVPHVSGSYAWRQAFARPISGCSGRSPRCRGSVVVLRCVGAGTSTRFRRCAPRADETKRQRWNSKNIAACGNHRQ